MMFLNAWWGTRGSVLWNYIGEESKRIDIFCFMETGEKFTNKCDEILPEYTSVSTVKDVFEEIEHSISVYVKSGIKILKSETILDDDIYTGASLFTEIEKDGRKLNIASVHGVANPGDKLDNPKRLEQSKIIVDYMAKIEGLKIIGGDFNLEKDTESVKMFEKNGYRNLIEEYKIKTTRNHFCWDV